MTCWCLARRAMRVPSRWTGWMCPATSYSNHLWLWWVPRELPPCSYFYLQPNCYPFTCSAICWSRCHARNRLSTRTTWPSCANSQRTSVRRARQGQDSSGSKAGREQHNATRPDPTYYTLPLTPSLTPATVQLILLVAYCIKIDRAHTLWLYRSTAYTYIYIYINTNKFLFSLCLALTHSLFLCVHLSVRLCFLSAHLPHLCRDIGV